MKTKKNQMCKNVGKLKINDEYYCFLHAPKKDTCSICLNNISSLYFLYCGHYFHRHCIQKWLKLHNNCPICRQDVLHQSHLNKYQSIMNQIDKDNINIVLDIALHCATTNQLTTHLKAMMLL